MKTTKKQTALADTKKQTALAYTKKQAAIAEARERLSYALKIAWWLEDSRAPDEECERALKKVTEANKKWKRLFTEANKKWKRLAGLACFALLLSGCVAEVTPAPDAGYVPNDFTIAPDFRCDAGCK